jgi:hypothetical protein
MDESERAFHYAVPHIAKVGAGGADNGSDSLHMLDGLTVEVAQVPHHWTASSDEMVASDMILTANRYKPYSLTMLPHESPNDIVEQLRELEDEIQDRLRELQQLLEGPP